MARFAFRIDECLPSLDGLEGVVLAGPVLETGFNFRVGEIVVVPTTSGDAPARCTAFPLVRWGAGRERWLTIAAVGVEARNVTKGAVAYAEQP